MFIFVGGLLLSIKKNKIDRRNKLNKRPKRRKYKDNPYTLSVDNDIYKVTFIDSLNKTQTIEINKDIFDTLDKFEL